LTQYDLVIIDEVSMLTAEQFERVVEMWKAASSLPCLVLLGDFWQLPVVDQNAKRCEESLAWEPNVYTVDFVEQVRCKDPFLQKKLNNLRTAQPDMKQLRQIMRGHLAWRGSEPTAWDILEVLRVTEEKTTIVTCTRRAAAKVNALAKKVLFEDRKKQVLATIPCDYEANEENYTEKGKLKTRIKLQPAQTTIFKGLRVYLTKNLNKKDDFVNGMSAEVTHYDPDSKLLEVKTRTGKDLSVHLITDDVEGHSRVTYFPVRVGYACTVQKVQGATLPHITIWLDVPACRAAAYVAMSRVQYDNQYLIGGNVCPRHFVPAM
jgi:ATP-dependent exoDNAse (exonuclease V) alpha subunit